MTSHNLQTSDVARNKAQFMFPMLPGVTILLCRLRVSLIVDSTLILKKVILNPYTERFYSNYD